MIIWVIGCWLHESESVASDGEVTNSLWLFLGGFASFKGSSMFVAMLTTQLKKKEIPIRKLSFRERCFTTIYSLHKMVFLNINT